MKHKKTLRRNCCANDLFLSGNTLECGNCGAREDEK